MTLTEIYEQQRLEREQFNKLRDQAWKDLQDKQQAITNAFGSKENIPENTRKQMDKEIETYHREWSTETGQRYQEMQQHHENQREAKTGLKPEVTKNAPSSPSKGDNLNEKQARMQKIIAQQQSIRKQQQEKKRGR